MMVGGSKAKAFAKRLRVSAPKGVAKRITKGKVEKAGPLPISRAKMTALQRSAKARRELAARLERRTPSAVKPERGLAMGEKTIPHRASSG